MFASDGTGTTLTLAASVEVPPVILRAEIPFGPVFWEESSCLNKTTTASAAAEDESGISSMTAWWGSPANPFLDNVEMKFVSGEYQGEVGPFPGVEWAGEIEALVTIVATDGRGNQTSSDPIPLEVLSC
jgi:hypothetical protein